MKSYKDKGLLEGEKFLKQYDMPPVHFILEDRTSVVQAWRKLGYTCLQVAEGDF